MKYQILLLLLVAVIVTGSEMSRKLKKKSKKSHNAKWPRIPEKYDIYNGQLTSYWMLNDPKLNDPKIPNALLSGTSIKKLGFFVFPR
jgi:hypothetical protein